MSSIDPRAAGVSSYLSALGQSADLMDSIGSMAANAGAAAPSARQWLELNASLPQLPESELRQLLSGNQTRQLSARGAIARGRSDGAHLASRGGTFAPTSAGRQSPLAQRYRFNLGRFTLHGQMSGTEYRGSLSKPIQLKSGAFLFHGRSYDTLQDLFRDIRFGRLDGVAGKLPAGNLTHIPSMPDFQAVGAVGSAVPRYEPSATAAKVFTNIFAGGPSMADGEPRIEDINDIMSGPGSLEDKLLLLMDKLASFLDSQIEDQMSKIEDEMQRAGQGGPAGGVAGGASGGAAGGPLGGHGRAARANGSGSTGASDSTSDKSNLQLLQAQLQQMIERRNQMFQTMTQILKSLNDTSLAIIRNLKA